ncbi:MULTISPECIES: V-type ATP synthase subunit D [Prolixibacter]|uniref:ATP synthase subunit D n=1 Tax=Prolixibacter denitrificans TaxID=1541063 RepID=A0A2P8C8I0_9BACT|nr:MULTISPECIES: V-type ATP synthase subunit D [Prolixibacter]PSK81272.1 V/A-type H+-transporting ATPase subunit D [Prolixibacter denitrificans]GET21644.1 ATP synthase subunit D [Prolixibacter denitrificans]GET24260.1 ATP synthase subunit D [Prolixibacter sp. NT017]
MAINFQYNKTALQGLEKQLKVRVKALPTIKNKESALRVEVKRAKDEVKRLNKLLEETIEEYDSMMALWGEFDVSLVRVKDVKMSVKKIAGVQTPILDGVEFEIAQFSVFSKPKWFLDGIKVVKELAEIGIEQEFFNQKMILLDHARKKTTQKVNLFEKVQIPGYEDAIRKIKRFLEDKENLSKSAQKIVKSRQETREVES